MITKLRNAKKRKSNHLLICLIASFVCLCFGGVCSLNVVAASNDRTYIINKRTRRIHTVDCPSVKQMSEKNKIYDSKENVIDVGDDTFIEGIIHKIDDWFQLRKGDILAREGHVHLYLGDGMAVDAPNFGWGRVYRSFPQTYEIEIKTLNDEKVISLKNGDGNIEYYPRIYRYRGTEDT